MLVRWPVPITLGLSLVLASGCPQPGDEAGGGWGDTGETGDSEGDGDGDGVEGEGDLRPPIDTGGDGDGDDDDHGDDDDDDDDGDDGGDGGDGGVDHDDRCWDRTWNGEQLPAVIFDNTIGRNDDFLGSCGLGAAPDFQLGFVAPWTGSFTFDTKGSSFDTVVYINPGECGTPEQSCNDDFVDLESRVTIDLEHGEIVTVTVDGAGPFEEGPLKLTITEAATPTCEGKLIPPNLPKQLFGDTSDGTNQLASGCGGAGAFEQVYKFIAPGPGIYRFSTEGSAIDTVLYTLEECGGAPLACNDDQGFELHSVLDAELDGGQELLVVVDGQNGDDPGEFVLTVEQL